MAARRCRAYRRVGQYRAEIKAQPLRVRSALVWRRARTSVPRGDDMNSASEQVFEVALQGRPLEHTPPVGHIDEQVQVAFWARVTADDRPEHAARPLDSVRFDLCQMNS